MNNKFYLESKIELHEETAELKKAVAAVINLPKDTDKQPDLLYFSAIFVSSGANLNRAYFLPSELLKAEHTIVNKALDVEHKEDDIIGHIYDRAFIDLAGNKLDPSELASMEKGEIDRKNIHVVIAGIIYKNRFPHIAEEVAKGQWKVSMECYYKDYDVKVGDVILTRSEAESLGLASDNSLFSKFGRVLKNGVEIAKGHVERVLRNICFSGCGIVKNPANPPSVILETANVNPIEPSQDEEVIVINLDSNNKLTSSNIIEGTTSVGNVVDENDRETSELVYNDSVGICISYKKRVFEHEPAGPDTAVLHEDWCTLYDMACTSFSRDTTDPKCLRNEFSHMIRASVEEFILKRNKKDRRDDLVVLLENKINSTKKLV